MNSPAAPSMLSALKLYLNKRIITLFFLGFSAGIPILLIFSSLSLWLREAGIDRASVTLFSWAALGYSFKYVWAPLVERIPVPILTQLMGIRRSWLLLAQLLIVASIVGMAAIDPSQQGNSLIFMAIAAVSLGFSSATQDILIDAYRIETGTPDEQAMMSSMYIAGYRVGMLVAGAGALYLADFWGSTSDLYLYSAWQKTYWAMALAMLIGIGTTLLMPEPSVKRDELNKPHKSYLPLILVFAVAVFAWIGSYQVLSPMLLPVKETLAEVFANQALASFLIESIKLITGLSLAFGIARLAVKSRILDQALVEESYISPIKDFFNRFGIKQAVLILALICLYRISDIVLGVIANIFYQDMGYTKSEIATVVKTFGLFMTIAGGFVGGILSVRFGTLKILFLGGILASATNLLFAWMASKEPGLIDLYLVISADNLAAGLAGAAFVAFLSNLVNVSFTAMQYAIFSSLMTFLPKLLGGYSGAMVDQLGYPSFFIATMLMGIPVLLLILYISKESSLTHSHT